VSGETAESPEAGRRHRPRRRSRRAWRPVRRGLALWSVLAALAAALSALTLPPDVRAGVRPANSAERSGSTVVVSGDRRGTVLPGRSYGPAMSSDGRWIAFDSDSSNLVSGGHGQVYLRDMRTGQIDLISATPKGTGADGESYAPSVSADGRWVAFVSEADDVLSGVGGDKARHVYLRDRVARRTRRLDLAPDGRSLVEGNSPAISADGRSVVYTAGVPEVSDGTADDQGGMFVYDTRTGGRERLGHVDGTDPAISGDGRWVVFSSEDRDLVPGDTNRKADCFRYDRRTHRVDLISTDSAGHEGNEESTGAVISPDGNSVVFVSSATNLTTDQVSARQAKAVQTQVYRRDLRTGRVRLVSTDGHGHAGNGASGGAVLSSDGRWVIYLSQAGDLPGSVGVSSAGGSEHVFRWDSLTGATSLVDVTPKGRAGNGVATSFPAVNADGSLVAFGSRAADLVPGAGGGNDAIYERRWPGGGATHPAGTPGRPAPLYLPGHEPAVPAGSAPIGDDVSATPAVSSDGRWVAFASRATNLVAGIGNHVQNVFVTDTRTHRVQLVSASSAGQPANADSADPSISADGRWVVFDSFANNLVPGSRGRSGEVYLHDMSDGTTVRVSVNLTGAEPDGQSGLARISSDGRYVAFESVAGDLVPGRPPRSQVYVWDRTTKLTTLISSGWLGGPGDAGSGDAAISTDGRYVAFESAADNLVPGTTPGITEVYVRDRALNTTMLVSRHTSPIGDDTSSHPSISADGRYVAFESMATNLLAPDLTGASATPSDEPPIDGDPHVLSHIYVRDLTAMNTVQVDVTDAGAPARGDSYHAAITADGRTVVFASTDPTLAPGGRRVQIDVYLRDLAARTTSRVSTAADTNQAVGASRTPEVDADGGLVVFASEASVAGPADPDGDIYAREVKAGRTSRVT
jgi:Tol biopolymer transport system component